MPEHVHLLVSESKTANPSAVIKSLKQQVGRRLLRNRRRQAGQLEFFERQEHFWQKRFYDFNVFTQRKRVEKLKYMHRNPVKRGLVLAPEQWIWSSYNSYFSAKNHLVKTDLVL